MADLLNTNWNKYLSVPKDTALSRGINHLNTQGKNYTTPTAKKPSISMDMIGGIMSSVQGIADFASGAMADFGISDYNPIQYGQYGSLEALNANSSATIGLDLQKNNIAGGAMQGAIGGAQTGMAFGPVGAAVGAVVGGVGRTISGLFGNRSKKREEARRYGEALEGLNAQASYLTSSEINKNMWNDFEFGGMMTNGGIYSNNVNIVAQGDTHNKNKYGGVPVSLDEQGKPNLVEEGEVIWNDYVFSNKLSLKEDLLKGTNLPMIYKEKTFAKIAEDIQKESQERPYNPISQRGLTDGLGKLIIAQEMEKLRDKEQNLEKMVEDDTNVFEKGGSMTSKQKKILDLYRAYAENGIDNPKMLEMLVKHDGLESGWAPHDNNWGNITAGSSYKGKVRERRDRDASGKVITQKFRTYSTVDEYVKDKLRLLKSSYDFDQNDSPEVFAKKLTGGNRKSYAWATDKEYLAKLNRMWGGNLDVRSASYMENDLPEEYKNEKGDTTTTSTPNEKPSSKQYAQQPIGISQSVEAPIIRDVKSSPSSPSSSSERRYMNYTPEGLTKDSLLALSPAIGNLAGYASSVFERPEIVQYERVAPRPVTERLNYQPVNDTYLINSLQNQYAGIREGIAQISGGHRGVGQTAILSNDRNMAESLYGAYNQANQINTANRVAATQFNADVQKFNSQADLQAQMYNTRIDIEEKTANEANRAALDERRQLHRNAVLENLEGLAQQLRWEKLAPVISMGYDQYGRKVKR